MFERINEQFKDLNDKKDGAILLEHSRTYHGNQEFELDITIISQCFDAPTAQLITKAVLINQLNDEETLNTKTEWPYVKLLGAVITR